MKKQIKIITALLCTVAMLMTSLDFMPQSAQADDIWFDAVFDTPGDQPWNHHHTDVTTVGAEDGIWDYTGPNGYEVKYKGGNNVEGFAWNIIKKQSEANWLETDDLMDVACVKQGDTWVKPTPGMSYKLNMTIDYANNNNGNTQLQIWNVNGYGGEAEHKDLEDNYIFNTRTGKVQWSCEDVDVFLMPGNEFKVHLGVGVSSEYKYNYQIVAGCTITISKFELIPDGSYEVLPQNQEYNPEGTPWTLAANWIPDTNPNPDVDNGSYGLMGYHIDTDAGASKVSSMEMKLLSTVGSPEKDDQGQRIIDPEKRWWWTSASLLNYAEEAGLEEKYDVSSGTISLYSSKATAEDCYLYVYVDNIEYQFALSVGDNQLEIPDFVYAGGKDITFLFDELPKNTVVKVNDISFEQESDTWETVPNATPFRPEGTPWTLYARFDADSDMWGAMQYKVVGSDLSQVSSVEMKLKTVSGWFDARSIRAILNDYLDGLEVGKTYKITAKVDFDESDVSEEYQNLSYEKKIRMTVDSQNYDFDVVNPASGIITFEKEFTYTETSKHVVFNFDQLLNGTKLSFTSVEITESSATTTAETTTPEPTTEEPTTVEPTTVEPTTVEPTTVEPTTKDFGELGYALSPWTFWQTGVSTDKWNPWEVCAYYSVYLPDDSDKYSDSVDANGSTNYLRTYSQSNHFFAHSQPGTHQDDEPCEVTVRGVSHGYVADIESNGWTAEWSTEDNPYLVGNKPYSVRAWNIVSVEDSNKNYKFRFNAYIDEGATRTGDESTSPVEADNKYARLIVSNPSNGKILKQKDIDITKQNSVYSISVPLQDYCEENGETLSTVKVEMQYGSFLMLDDIIKHKEINWRGKIHVEDCELIEDDGEPEETTTEEPTTVEPTTIDERKELRDYYEQFRMQMGIDTNIDVYNVQLPILEGKTEELLNRVDESDVELKNRLLDLQEKITTIKNNYNRVDDALTDIESKIENLSITKGEIAPRLAQLSVDLEWGVISSIADSNSVLEQIEKDYVLNEVGKLREELDSIDAIVSSLNSLVGVVPEGETLQGEIVDLQNCVQAIEGELNSVDLNQIEANKHQIEALSTRLVQETNTLTQSLMQETQDRINATNSLLSTINGINNTLTDKDTYLQNQVNTLNSQIQSTSEEIESINNAIVSIQNDISSNATNIGKNASDIQSIVNQLRDIVADLNTVDDRIQSAKDDTLSLSKAYTDQKMAEMNEDYTDKFNKQNDEIDRLNKEILGLKMSSSTIRLGLSYASKSLVNLSWNKHPYADGYEVYVMKPGQSQYEFVSDTNSLVFAYGFAMNSSYKFMVKAYMNDEKSGTKIYAVDSNVATANVVAPAKVVLKKVKAGKKKCTVQWNAVPKAVGYQIYYKQKKAKTITVKANQLSQVIKKLKKKKKVTVKVRAFARYGIDTLYGAWSNTKSVKIK